MRNESYAITALFARVVHAYTCTIKLQYIWYIGDDERRVLVMASTRLFKAAAAPKHVWNGYRHTQSEKRDVAAHVTLGALFAV